MNRKEAESMFKQLSEAYVTLLDEKQKTPYEVRKCSKYRQLTIADFSNCSLTFSDFFKRSQENIKVSKEEKHKHAPDHFNSSDIFDSFFSNNNPFGGCDFDAAEFRSKDRGKVTTKKLDPTIMSLHYTLGEILSRAKKMIKISRKRYSSEAGVLLDEVKVLTINLST